MAERLRAAVPWFLVASFSLLATHMVIYDLNAGTRSLLLAKRHSSPSWRNEVSRGPVLHRSRCFDFAACSQKTLIHQDSMCTTSFKVNIMRKGFSPCTFACKVQGIQHLHGVKWLVSEVRKCVALYACHSEAVHSCTTGTAGSEPRQQ
jgi:hypothetical protein